MTTPAQKNDLLSSIGLSRTDATEAGTDASVVDNYLLLAENETKKIVPTTTPPSEDESPQGTTCHRNSGAVMIGGKSWTINDVNYLRVDGAPTPATWQCAQMTPRELLIWNHVLWGNNENAPAQWQTIDHLNGNLGPISADPRGTIPPIEPPIEPPIDPPPTSSDYDPNDYLTITTNAELVKKRADLINYIWPGGVRYLWSRSRRPSLRGIPAARPTITQGVAPPFPVAASKRCDQWRTTISYAGIAMYTFGYCYRPKAQSNGKFALLMPGHNNSLSARSFDALCQDLCAGGTTVCVQGMVLWAGNYSESWANHDQMAVLNSASPYLDHALISVNQAVAEGFVRIGGLGLSGGGQQLCVAAAVDPRIQLAYTVSGWQPLALWSVAPAVVGGDWEQWNSLGPNFSVCSYEDLALMGASGTGRKHVQGCNTTDPYFMGTKDDFYSGQINSRATVLGGAFAIHRYTYPDHTLDATVRAAFIADL